MSKQVKEWSFGIPPDTEFELIAIRGEVVYKQITSFSEALDKLKNKSKGWVYRIYQKGFSQIKETKIK